MSNNRWETTVTYRPAGDDSTYGPVVTTYSCQRTHQQAADVAERVRAGIDAHMQAAFASTLAELATSEASTRRDSFVQRLADARQGLADAHERVTALQAAIAADLAAGQDPAAHEQRLRETQAWLKSAESRVEVLEQLSTQSARELRHYYSQQLEMARITGRAAKSAEVRQIQGQMDALVNDVLIPLWIAQRAEEMLSDRRVIDQYLPPAA